MAGPRDDARLWVGVLFTAPFCRELLLDARSSRDRRQDRSPSSPSPCRVQMQAAAPPARPRLLELVPVGRHSCRHRHLRLDVARTSSHCRCRRHQAPDSSSRGLVSRPSARMLLVDLATARSCSAARGPACRSIPLQPAPVISRAAFQAASIRGITTSQVALSLRAPSARRRVIGTTLAACRPW